jgi:DNA-binding NarL/FixJ family response regulator
MCIVAFTVSTSRLDVLTMMNAGVDGYLTKTTHSEDLADLLDAALAGRKPVSKEVAGYLLDIDDEIDTGIGVEHLTPREREVVNLIARGYTYRETAQRLQISVKTLETHMAHIFAKLGIASRHELAALVGPTFTRPDDD